MKRKIAIPALIIAIIVIWFVVSPPRFWLNLTKRVEPTAAVGEQLVRKYDCRQCHRIGGEGALKAPDLTGVTLRAGDPALVSLRLWLQNPRAVRSNTAMPNFHLSDTEIDAILLYLTQLDAQSSGG
ncbi:MAG: cytochrome c [Chloroflexi bacterium]|nr:MAG: cytochrome c [Chloroflexota bacterium]